MENGKCIGLRKSKGGKPERCTFNWQDEATKLCGIHSRSCPCGTLLQPKDPQELPVVGDPGMMKFWDDKRAIYTKPKPPVPAPGLNVEEISSSPEALSAMLHITHV